MKVRLMTVDEKLFVEDSVELAPDLFKKKGVMGSINLPVHLVGVKDWILKKKETLRPWQEFGNHNF